ncbi:sensor histidine kinase [Rhodococcoides fascians]|uniref:sensor histidine kinase n=1 Tax=Rhodococcoides fascians TaxID=1828 RepID=UPI000563F1E2|nr:MULTISPECIES: histidine kinase [Rhodococcus]OZF06453.1 histidine kinase [Rhodococcus sp. 15-1189-1-1a]OZF22268.1 histidine kinase [Rhodococcus sp. 14-2686-1-2]
MIVSRRRAGDLGAMTFSLFIAAMVVFDGVTAADFSDLRVATAIAIGAVATALLWWRRRRPVGIALVLAALTVFSDAAGGAELVAIYTVASMRTWRVTAAIVALHLVASLVYARFFSVGDSVVSTGILSLALLSIPMAWGVIVKARREVIDSLRERAERAEAAAADRADRVRGQERERIAREMHDALAHRISMVSLHAGALEVRSDADAADIEKIAGTIRTSAHGALNDLREILGVLRSDEDSPPMKPGSSIDDVPALIDEVRAAGVVVDYENRLKPGDIPATMGRNVFRVVQEGLTNARKHAAGSAVQVSILPEGDGLFVSVANALGGHDSVVPGSRTGLIGLSERLSLAGGRLDHGVKTVDGTVGYVLEAWLPWPT